MTTSEKVNVTAVIMDNGNVFSFNESIEDFIKKFCNDDITKFKYELIKGDGFYISSKHIVAIKEETADMKMPLSASRRD